VGSEDRKPGWLRGTWRALRRPTASYSVLSLTIIGVAIGIIFWGGFNTVVEATNTETFCIGCHEMRDNVYEEYKETIHYTNRTGVRAVCSDCHVPKEWGPKMVRKVQASRELYGKVIGTIDTREKFEAKRLELARREWARMKANDSLECRNCHSLESMDGDKQKQRARKQHERAQADGDTCIDCHKGIAHHKPNGMTEDDE
jgi:cytochrome c-type protein NapC